MERVSVLLFLSCSLLAAIHAGDLETCARNYKRVGCFTDKSDQSSSMLIYDRYGIQWKNIEAYIYNLACKCETEARKNKGYAGFAIHFWGECYGKTQAQLDAVGGKTESKECTGDQTYKGCPAEAKECAGHAYTDFVYMLTPINSFEKTFCNDTSGSIECDKGYVQITGGSFAPRTAEVCGPSITRGWMDKCSVFSVTDLRAYQGSCRKAPKCEIEGWTDPFEDPCPGIQKYLKLQYTCKSSL